MSFFPFPTVPVMTLIKAKGHNTFEWKISINVKNAESGSISIDGYKAQVKCARFEYCTSNITFRYTLQLYQFQLFFHDSSIYPVYYTFSILDREGRTFVTSKGKVLKDGDPERVLSVVYRSYLNACNLIESGTFTVRFSVHRQKNAQKGSDPIKEKSTNVADSATNTTPLITKNSSTNTETSTNVADSATNTTSLITKNSSTNTDGLDGGDTNLLETLSNDFSTFYENKTDTDCLLRVSDAQFHVHRAVLSARSSVFSAMFHHDTAETRSGEVNIQDVKATTLGDVLYYVYSGKIRGITTNTAATMYKAADKYDLSELRSKCFEFLKSNLTLDNFCEVALLAHTHEEMELEERVVWFIEENLDEVLKSSTWQQFLKDKTLLASKLLTSGFQISKKKQFRDTTSKLPNQKLSLIRDVI